jgi:hypothetical protein
MPLIIVALYHPVVGIEPEPKKDARARTIVGSWVLDSQIGKLPPGCVIEFTADGKLRTAVNLSGLLIEAEKEASYEIVNNDVVMKRGDETRKAPLIELTESRLVIRDDPTAEKAVFKRLKPDKNMPLPAGAEARKILMERLRGKWVGESGPEKVKTGWVWEFTADGKMNLWLSADQLANPAPATLDYVVKGDVIDLGARGKGKGRIVEITAEKLVIKDSDEPIAITFKRFKHAKDQPKK